MGVKKKQKKRWYRQYPRLFSAYKYIDIIKYSTVSLLLIQLCCYFVVSS